MIDTHNPEIRFAIQAVRLASRLVRLVQSEMVTPALTKDDRSPVTVADFASQALIAHLLEVAFPQDPLVAEEDAAILRTPEESQSLERVTQFTSQFASGATPESVCAWIDRGGADPLNGGGDREARRFWTLDPIDGTKGFLRGDQYVVALALIQDGMVQLGSLGCPNLRDGFQSDIGGPGSIVIAARGKGAWITSVENDRGGFEQIQVSDQRDPSQARILRSFESGHTNVSQIDEFAHTLGIQSQDPVRMDSQAKYALLGAGRGDIYLRLLSPSRPDYREKIWDQAAGSLIVQEAGGQVTDLGGKALDFGLGRTLAANRGILASNGRLHPAALEALRAIHA
jgi:HAL2 family 3'(2'),5'-bisphosphate nucleotidase